MDFGYALKNFALPVNDSAVQSASINKHLTLRNICKDYRDNDGISWVPNALPEASAAQSADQIPCLNRFCNIVGHMDRGEIICFEIKRANSALDMKEQLEELLSDAIETGRLWAIPNTVKYTFTGNNITPWNKGTERTLEHENHVLDLLFQSHGPPLSANITHAAMESDHYMDNSVYKDMFLYPHNAAISIGLVGSSHDNQCIDMSPGEEKKVANMAMRSWRDEFLGYICSGHTSHSGEAGRVRRVTCDVSVRLLNHDTIDDLGSTFEYMSDNSGTMSRSRDWTIFCMGIYYMATEDEVKALCRKHRIYSHTKATKYSLHISADLKFINISISSGTLIKLTSSDCYADNIETHSSDRLKVSIKPRIDTTGKDMLRACFSIFFNLIAFIASNRSPRPLISSVQMPQAACLVWCPGNAAVSPCYSFNPLMMTPLYSNILQDIKNDEASISCHIPGENPIVLFLNMEYNYEDAIIISQRYLDNGGFSTISMCSYNLPQNEYIPPVNATMCGILSPWWKSPCQEHCTHRSEDLTEGKTYTVGYKPTGVVHSITPLKSGEINVRIKSYQQLQRGDKLSMGHGQKGIVVPTPYEDMPRAYSKKHGHIVPDMVMAMSSVVNRQTNGVLYEAAKSIELMYEKAPVPHVVVAGEICDVEDDFLVMHSTTGELYRTTFIDEKMNLDNKPARASLGILRVANQTQMSRERHQVSHVKVGKFTLRTPDGRARGGGVAWGEMEGQTSIGAGLTQCNDELIGRGDKTVQSVCTRCQRLGLLCTCTTEEYHMPTKISYDLMVLDCMNAIIYNGSFQYQLTPELC